MLNMILPSLLGVVQAATEMAGASDAIPGALAGAGTAGALGAVFLRNLIARLERLERTAARTEYRLGKIMGHMHITGAPESEEE